MDSSIESGTRKSPDLPPHATSEPRPQFKRSFYGCLAACVCLLAPLAFGDLLIMALFESTLTDAAPVLFIGGYLLFWLVLSGVYVYASWRLIVLSKAFAGKARIWTGGTAKALAALPWILLLVALSLASTWRAERETLSPMAGGKNTMVSVSGLDHLPDHLSVDFTINDSGKYRANGGDNGCCTYFPLEWHDGLIARVEWYVTNWRDCTGESYEAIVPVTRYERNPGHVYVHFLADGSVRVVPTNKTYQETDYPGPHDAIPQKYPREVWPPRQHCPQWFNDTDVSNSM